MPATRAKRAQRSSPVWSRSTPKTPRLVRRCQNCCKCDQSVSAKDSTQQPRVQRRNAATQTKQNAVMQTIQNSTTKTKQNSAPRTIQNSAKSVVKAEREVAKAKVVKQNPQAEAKAIVEDANWDSDTEYEEPDASSSDSSNADSDSTWNSLYD